MNTYKKTMHGRLDDDTLIEKAGANQARNQTNPGHVEVSLNSRDHDRSIHKDRASGPDGKRFIIAFLREVIAE